MKKNTTIALIIPVWNEAECIGQVVDDFASLQLHKLPLLDEIVVVDSDSEDGSAEIARSVGATVVSEGRSGYGQACISGLSYLSNRPQGAPEIVVFVDGDGSNYANDLLDLLSPFDSEAVEFTLGSRIQRAEKGALTIQQQAGNHLACFLMRRIFHVNYSDLGPFRAIRWNSLQQLHMNDTTYGWTIEMQIKAAKFKLETVEINVQYRHRQAGRSKVSGTLRGVIGASYAILSTIFKYH
ncbi:MAG: glycosyltransferase involved in cell wall biosynthesis [Candidatus Endobugula sp.]